MRLIATALVINVAITSSMQAGIGPRRLAIGIDVGTGSARAGVVDTANGELLATHKKEIVTWTPQAEYYEQSSDDIWAACVQCVRTAMSSACASDDDEIVGIGFDATCAPPSHAK